MVLDKNYKVIQVRKSDYEYIDEIRKTPCGDIPYAEVLHNMIQFWKDNK